MFATLLLLLLPTSSMGGREWTSLDGDWQFTLLEETEAPGNYTATMKGNAVLNHFPPIFIRAYKRYSAWPRSLPAWPARPYRPRH